MSVSKETYVCVKRDLCLCQKRPMSVSKDSDSKTGQYGAGPLSKLSGYRIRIVSLLTQTQVSFDTGLF